MLVEDSNFGRSLPVRDAIWPDESGNGYALRMVGRNSLRYSELAELVSSIGHCYIANSAAPFVAYLFGAQAYMVRRAIPELFVAKGKRQISFMGQVLMRTYLVRHTRPQLCPVCMQEKGYAKALWDLSLATACTVHDVQLIDRCPSCARPVSWRRPSLFFCRCGVAFTENMTHQASPLEVWFNQCLEHKLISGIEPSKRDEAGCGFISSLGLDILMRLVRSLGLYCVLSNGKAMPGKVTRILSTNEMRRVVELGVARCLSLNSDEQSKYGPAWDLRGVSEDAEYEDLRRLRQLFSLAQLVESGKAWISDPQQNLDFDGIADE